MARNKSAIIVAGSRFNCYPRIDFTINIFGHRVSLYYYSTITIITTSTSASFHRSLFFIGSFEKCFIVRKREVASTRFLLSVVFTIAYSTRELFNCQTGKKVWI